MIFSNGKARITRLVIFELLCGIVIMIIGQILANLPSQSWLTPKQIGIACFVLGTVLTTIKGLEMFFNKTISLFKDYDAKAESDIVSTLQPPNEKPPVTPPAP